MNNLTRLNTVLVLPLLLLVLKMPVMITKLISEHDCKIQPHVEEQKGSVDEEGVVGYVHPDK